MFGPYRRVLSTPGALNFTLAGALGRLPLSMTGLGIVLLMAERLDSYGKAGIVSAGYALAAAACAPLQGRWADRYGQAVVLTGAGVLFALGLTGLLVLSSHGVLPATVCAMITGMGAPQTGNMIRRRWTHVLPDRSGLQTAFALEAVLDEAVFIIGPMLVTFLALSVADLAGLGVAAFAAVVGAGTLAAQRRTQPPTTGGTTTVHGPLPWGLLGPVTGAAVLLGVLFGSAEIVVVAFAEEAGHKTWAGALLAIWAAGSLVAGVIVGAMPEVNDPIRWLRATTACLAVLFLPLPFAPNLAWLSVGILATGFMVSPTLIGAVNLVERTVVNERLTEALTWLTTGLAVGVAPGAILAGWAIDNGGASAGFWVPAGAAIGTALLARILNPPASHLAPA